MGVGHKIHKRTDTGTNVFYRILFPHGLFGRIESELGEREVRHEAVDMGLQKYPCRFWLDAVKKRVSGSRSEELIAEGHHSVKNWKI